MRTVPAPAPAVRCQGAVAPRAALAASMSRTCVCARARARLCNASLCWHACTHGHVVFVYRPYIYVHMGNKHTTCGAPTFACASSKHARGLRNPELNEPNCPELNQLTCPLRTPGGTETASSPCPGTSASNVPPGPTPAGTFTAYKPLLVDGDDGERACAGASDGGCGCGGAEGFRLWPDAGVLRPVPFPV